MVWKWGVFISGGSITPDAPHLPEPRLIGVPAQQHPTGDVVGGTGEFSPLEVPSPLCSAPPQAPPNLGVGVAAPYQNDLGADAAMQRCPTGDLFVDWGVAMAPLPVAHMLRRLGVHHCSCEVLADFGSPNERMCALKSCTRPCHGQSSGLAASPAFTGFCRMYSCFSR